MVYPGSSSILGPYNQPVKLDESASFNVKPIATEWLSRSAVVMLKSPSTPELVSKALDHANFPDVSVKSLGGLSMILTFISKEIRDLALTNHTLKDWFFSFKPWNGESASLSRFVWIKCRGLPLQSWNLSTFRLIGDYCGVFINTDAETGLGLSYDIGRFLISTEYQEKIEEWINLIVNGKVYKVRIWEEECDDPFTVIFKDKENIAVQTGTSLNNNVSSEGVFSGKHPVATNDPQTHFHSWAWPRIYPLITIWLPQVKFLRKPKSLLHWKLATPTRIIFKTLLTEGLVVATVTWHLLMLTPPIRSWKTTLLPQITLTLYSPLPFQIPPRLFLTLLNPKRTELRNVEEGSFSLIF